MMDRDARVFTLFPGELQLDYGNGRVQSFPLDRFAEVQLVYANHRNMPDSFHCQLRLRQGGRLDISSLHYRSLADYVPQDAEYRHFVQALHEELAKVPGLQFRRGFTQGLHVLMVLASIFGGGILLLVTLGALLTNPLLGAVLGLAVFPFTVWMLYKGIKNNRPGTYDPQRIPIGLLP
jgi:hypothetical protein